MFQTKVVEKINKHILRSTSFFFKSAIYEIMWKTVIERGRPQMTTWSVRIACSIPKATNTHSEYVTLIAFPVQQWLHERSSVSCYSIMPVFLKTRINVSCIYRLFLPQGEHTPSTSARSIGFVLYGNRAHSEKYMERHTTYTAAGKCRVCW